MIISVVIPLYNAAGSIERALDSVLAQTFAADYQIIVVDDGSADDGAQVVERYVLSHPEASIELVRKPNGGVSSARNAGLRMARGEWIALLDSDDEWLPEKTSVQMAAVREHPEISFIGSNIVGSRLSLFGRKKDRLMPVRLGELFIKWHPHTPTVMFRHEILDAVGYYNEAMRYSEDCEFMLRVCRTVGAWFTPEELTVCGGGKPLFGHSGLSGNLRGMQRGQEAVVRYARRSGDLTAVQAAVAMMFCKLKYWRRIILTRWRR